jgi:hypothetical protein
MPIEGSAKVDRVLNTDTKHTHTSYKLESLKFTVEEELLEIYLLPLEAVLPNFIHASDLIMGFKTTFALFLGPISRDFSLKGLGWDLQRQFCF